MSHARGQPDAPGAFLDAGVVHGSSDVPWPEDRLVELVDAVRGAALYPFDDVIELLPLAQEQEIGERELRNRRVGLTSMPFWETPIYNKSDAPVHAVKETMGKAGGSRSQFF